MCARHIYEGQKTILNPGRTLGCLEFLKVMRDNGLRDEVSVAGTRTTIYTSWAIEECMVGIIGTKDEVWLASLPCHGARWVAVDLGRVLPRLCRWTILVTGLCNMGPILHPILAILNLGWIEKENAFFKCHYDAISPIVARMLEKLDLERLRACEAMGVRPLPIIELLGITYQAIGADLQ